MPRRLQRFEPQQVMSPLASSAQLLADAVVTAIAGDDNTSGSDSLGSSSSPIASMWPRPSSPKSLRPQHWTAPLSSAAHECPLALTEIAVAQPSSATNPTSAGSSSSPIGSVVPSPSWPNWLGPQHFTWPLSNSAQLWLATANSTTRVGVPTQPCSGSSSVVSLVSSVSPVSLVSS